MASFTYCVEDGLSSFSVPFSPSIDSAVDEFTRNRLAASKRHVPDGHVRGNSLSFSSEIRKPSSLERIRGPVALTPTVS